ncbi:Detected protein of unknown function [Hibiscus syriacus]|uniref:Kinesin motor domain-containing protein n=1 Tax=Hibiscus syriacus TaxID=106335 RepID=A0A6A3AGY4_HIBSY|nr:Detected protein of unknown function [Hibiscus syriacus]
MILYSILLIDFFLYSCGCHSSDDRKLCTRVFRQWQIKYPCRHCGSERASQTLSAGARLKEGCHINRSLLTLGTVIRNLSKERNGHIPFRDSKLTRILQSSLGGNARTAVICTLSLARTHVEQSRNTLFFASCAKEVTTNAQVNVVVSDKALVKQLQRELARLENELRNARPTSVSSDSAALLRQKDQKIQKLKEEVNTLVRQRELVKSEVEVLLQTAKDESPGDEKAVKIWAIPDPQYPKLRVQNSWDFGHSSIVTPVMDVGIVAPCKEVRCINSGRSSMNRYSDSNVSESNPKKYQNYNMSSPRERTDISGLLDIGNEDRSKRDSVSLHLKNSSNHPDIAFPSPEKPYLWQLKEEIYSRRSLKLTRSISCKFPEKLSTLKYDLPNEGLSRTGSQSSSTTATEYELNAMIEKNESQSYLMSAPGIEHMHPDVPTPEEQNNTAFSTSMGGAEEMSTKQLADHAVQVTEPIVHGKDVKDVGLDPIPDNYGSHSAWPSEFKRLQREIIELWDACNVSLVQKIYIHEGGT